jgi:hypothetical protein
LFAGRAYYFYSPLGISLGLNTVMFLVILINIYHYQQKNRAAIEARSDNQENEVT